jgi:glycerol-3-phosphate acyltransferase PlsY
MKTRQRRIRWISIATFVALTVAPVVWLEKTATRRAELVVGGAHLLEVGRAATGHQRADRVAFIDRGKRLVVTCPRYNRAVIYRVTAGETLELDRDMTLRGKPVAVCTTHDRFYLLERPPGDARHVEPGWCEAFDFEGRPVGSRLDVGFYPDDMALSPDGRHAFVLTSGRAEGDPSRPAPALTVIALDADAPQIIGRLTFDERDDDPARITLSRTGDVAVVTLRGSEQAAAVDLGNPAQPRLVDRMKLSTAEVPYVSADRDDAILMPVSSASEAVWVTDDRAKVLGAFECVAATLPHGSGVRLQRMGSTRELGRLILRGSMNLGRTKPTGLAYSADRGLLAVANRSGGVHLIAIRPGTEAARDANALAVSEPQR